MENLIYNIIELEGNNKYLIINQASYRGDTYYLANKTDEKEEELSDNFVIFKNILNQGKRAFEVVTDEGLLDVLIKYFSPSNN